jgi:hypothetical protein
MLRKIGYDLFVRLVNRATGAGLALILLMFGFVALALTTTAGAQVNGMPASVTSPGFGGRQVNGVAPSVTSLGPRGEDVASDPSGDQYNGGPTIFDRRGSGAPPPPSTSYPARSTSYRAAQADPADPGQSDAASDSDQPQTVLVFKDGHQVEVANYAIVGSTLYDLSSGHRQKIALSDLDLSATSKQNDDRGIDFQLPTKSQAN